MRARRADHPEDAGPAGGPRSPTSPWTHRHDSVAGCDCSGAGSRGRGHVVGDASMAAGSGAQGGVPIPPTRLLIVDDHDMFADSLRMALSAHADFEVVGTAATLAQAKNLVATTAPDVVLLDHRLPDGLGVDSISDLRAI